MGRKFKIVKRYYDEDYDLYKKGSITIKEGLTVLVGCNGTGKTTLIHQIKRQLKDEGIPVISFDNLHEGGSRAASSAGFYGDFQFLAASMTSSEGENIIMNVGNLATSLRSFIQIGEVKSRTDDFTKSFAKAMWGDLVEEKKEIPKERWILLDAIDSGLSVDNIVDIKEYLFKAIFEDAGECQVYIIISANGYELARGENCFDVYNGKYIKFSDYEDYRQFILNSRNIKNKRYGEK